MNKGVLILIGAAAFVLIVVFGGVMANSIAVKANEAAARRATAEANLERAKAQADAIVIDARAAAYADRAIATVPMMALATPVIIISIAVVIFLMRDTGRRYSQPPVDDRGSADRRIVISVNGADMTLPAMPGINRRDQIDYAIQMAYLMGVQNAQRNAGSGNDLVGVNRQIAGH